MDAMVKQTQEWLNATYGAYSDYAPISEDGVTGSQTFKSLIWALQLEIGVSPRDGVFGNDTIQRLNTTNPTISQTSSASANIIYIIQGSLWCKGYNPTGFTGNFGPGTASAIKEFQTDAGIVSDGVVRPYILQAIMNTDGYKFTSTNDPYDTYKHEVQLGLNQFYGSTIGLTAPNGLWERKSHQNLIEAAQIEWGCLMTVFGELVRCSSELKRKIG